MELYFTNLDFPEIAGVPFPFLLATFLGAQVVSNHRPSQNAAKSSNKNPSQQTNMNYFYKVGPYDPHK